MKHETNGPMDEQVAHRVAQATKNLYGITGPLPIGSCPCPEGNQTSLQAIEIHESLKSKKVSKVPWSTLL